MAVEHKEEVCEACGCLAEVGTIIHEGDDVVVIPVEGDDEADALAQVSSELHTVDGGVVLNTTLQFTCTAEKMFFEMRARSVR